MFRSKLSIRKPAAHNIVYSLNSANLRIRNFYISVSSEVKLQQVVQGIRPISLCRNQSPSAVTQVCQSMTKHKHRCTTIHESRRYLANPSRLQVTEHFRKPICPMLQSKHCIKSPSNPRIQALDQKVPGRSVNTSLSQ